MPGSDIDFHRPLDATLDLDFLFSIHDFRKITATLQIHYAGRVYQIVTNHPAYYYARQEVLITRDYTGSISAWFDGHLLTLKEIEKRPKQELLYRPNRLKPNRSPRLMTTPGEPMEKR